MENSPARNKKKGEKLEEVLFGSIFVETRTRLNSDSSSPISIRVLNPILALILLFPVALFGCFVVLPVVIIIPVNYSFFLLYFCCCFCSTLWLDSRAALLFAVIEEACFDKFNHQKGQEKEEGGKEGKPILTVISLLPLPRPSRFDCRHFSSFCRHHSSGKQTKKPTRIWLHCIVFLFWKMRRIYIRLERPIKSPRSNQHRYSRPRDLII